MTALALAIAGLAPGFFVALLYWVPRAAVRARVLEVWSSGTSRWPIPRNGRAR